MTPKLEVRGVDYSYHTMEGETKALSDISFHVNSGEFLCIVGPSGCGKSTLLSLLAGLLAPERGRFFLTGFLSGRGLRGSGTCCRGIICLSGGRSFRMFHWGLRCGGSVIQAFEPGEGASGFLRTSVFLRCASVGAFRGDAAAGCFDPDSCFRAGSSAS